MRHQFSHQITKAWCIKIFNKPQGTVISVTATFSTEMQTYAQPYFKSLTSKVGLRYGSLSAITVIGRKTCMMGGGGGEQEEGREKEGRGVF